jgi:hypothetical protein
MFPPDASQFQMLSRVPLATIDAIVSRRLGPTRVKGNAHAQPTALNRQIAMYLAKHVGRWSTTAIGKFYNDRHHTTVLWALKHVGVLRTSDRRIDSVLFSLTQEIQSRSVAIERDDGHRLSRASELPFSALRLEDEFLELLVDKIVERLKSRAILDRCD